VTEVVFSHNRPRSYCPLCRYCTSFHHIAAVATDAEVCTPRTPSVGARDSVSVSDNVRAQTSVGSRAKAAEPIELPFGLQTRTVYSCSSFLSLDIDTF